MLGIFHLVLLMKVTKSESKTNFEVINFVFQVEYFFLPTDVSVNAF